MSGRMPSGDELARGLGQCVSRSLNELALVHQVELSMVHVAHVDAVGDDLPVSLCDLVDEAWILCSCRRVHCCGGPQTQTVQNPHDPIGADPRAVIPVAVAPEIRISAIESTQRADWLRRRIERE